MPIHRCSIDGRSGWKWGESGKCYVGSRGRSKALRQARAIRASGWVENVARRPARASRIDPSRTTMLREKFRRELVGRYDRVRRAVLQVVGRENLFRIVENREYVPGPKYPFTTDPERVEAFTAWLKERMDGEVLPTDDAYWERYAAEGFTRGAGRAFDDVNRLKRATAFGGDERMAHYLGTREQFLQSSFGQAETVDKLKILAGRVYTDLKGVNEAVAAQLNRVLVDGLSRGENPRTIAREMAKGIDGIGKRRAETIARTEIIRAHAEGQLDAMEKLGVAEVGVMAEWSTAGDDRVCDLCGPLEGKVLPITEAHSLIPLHPNCRCTWIPSVSAPTKKVPEKKQVEPETVQKIKPTIEELHKFLLEARSLEEISRATGIQEKSMESILSLEIQRKRVIVLESGFDNKVKLYKSTWPEEFPPIKPGPKTLDESREALSSRKILLKEVNKDIPNWAAKRTAQYVADTVGDLSDRCPGFFVSTFDLQFEKGASFTAQTTLGEQVVYGTYSRAKGMRFATEIPKMGDVGGPSLTGFSVGNDVTTGFLHEFGHHVHFKLMTNSERLDWSAIAKPYLGEAAHPYVSIYAKSNEQELFAEAFAAYNHPRYSPGSLPKDIEEFLERIHDQAAKL